jgi:hypothetical protein
VAVATNVLAVKTTHKNSFIAVSKMASNTSKKLIPNEKNKSKIGLPNGNPIFSYIIRKKLTLTCGA